jgi:vancomycin permeability regulator SanA
MAVSTGRRVTRGIVMTAFTALAVGLSIGLIAKVYVDASASRHMYSTAADTPEAPVALVLGAQVNPDGSPSAFLKARLDLAHELYRAGKVRVILVSGDNGTIHYNEPDNMRRYLIQAGVPAEHVVADYAGFDTYDSCVRAKEIFGVEQLTVVTQSYHLMRAVATCRAVGIDARGVGDDSVGVYADIWGQGQVRELLANYKMAWDILSGRQPVLGEYETSVDEALGR